MEWIITSNIDTIVSSILTFIIFPFNIYFIKKDKEKKLSYVTNIAGVIIAVITIIFIIVKCQYTVVPDVYDLSGESAKIKITDASLEYDKHDFYEDDEKIVVSMFPDAGTVVKKQSTIRVIMVNKNSDIALSSILEDIGRETTIDDKILYGINSSHLELIVNDIGAYLSTEKEKNFRDIGHIKIENAKVQLIDYFSNKTVMTEFSNEYGLVNFYNIKPGIYYFKTSCNGYENSTMDIPFKIIYDENYKDDPGLWRLSLKRENQEFYDLEFKIKVTHNGKPFMGKEFQARVIHKEYNREAYHSMTLVCDDSGYLSIRQYDTVNNVTTQKLEPVTILLGKDYFLEIEYDGMIYVVDNVEGNEYRICLDD